jgi:hypothetical protein
MFSYGWVNNEWKNGISNQVKEWKETFYRYTAAERNESSTGKNFEY